MIYDYYNYNCPKTIGNKNTYAYGNRYQSIEHCGFINANTRAQAQTVLNANNRAWHDNCELKHFTPQEIKQELERRKALKAVNNG